MIIAVLGVFFDVKDISLAVASGLVGYLSKDSNVEINHGDNTNTYNNTDTDDKCDLK